MISSRIPIYWLSPGHDPVRLFIYVEIKIYVTLYIVISVKHNIYFAKIVVLATALGNTSVAYLRHRMVIWVYE